MDARDSKQFFQQADNLFRGGRFGDALILLEKLNRAHPNQKNVLFPMAMCLTELGRGKEAVPICDQLIAEYDLPRAKALRERIIAGAPTERNEAVADPNAIPGVDMDALANLMDDTPKRQPPPLPSQGGFEPKPWIIGCTIFVVVSIALGALQARQDQIIADYEKENRAALGPEFSQFTQEDIEAGNFDAELYSDFPWNKFVPDLIVGILLFYLNTIFGIYLGLRVQDKLIHNEPADDAKDIALYSLISIVLFCIPVLGWIAIAILLYRHYELNCGGLFILYAVALGTVVACGFAIEVIAAGTSLLFI